MKFFDFTNPFYKPLWIRVAIVALCVGWALVELFGGHLIWAALFGGIGVYAAWQFATIDYNETPKD